MKTLISVLGMALVAIVAISPSLFAQSAPPPPGVPLDGGVSLLIAAGAALGVKKLVSLKRGK
jgi:preprotein translocase subunit SecY